MIFDIFLGVLLPLSHSAPRLAHSDDAGQSFTFNDLSQYLGGSVCGP